MKVIYVATPFGETNTTGGEGMKLLLLLSGKAQAGKDTFADSIEGFGIWKGELKPHHTPACHG